MEDFSGNEDGKISYDAFKAYMISILEKHSSNYSKEKSATQHADDEENDEEDIYSDGYLASEAH